MFVKNMMNKDIVSVFPEASISLAFQIMKEKSVRQIPVIKDGILVGMLTDELLNEFTPSKATSLSIYELNYILSKTKVEEIMHQDLITCSGDDLLSSAALLMIQNDVNMIPVIENDKRIIGLITRNDIIDAFVELLGMKGGGCRLAIQAKNQPGALAKILGIITQHGYNVSHISNFNDNTDGSSQILIRLESKVDHELISSLEGNGYKIIRQD